MSAAVTLRLDTSSGKSTMLVTCATWNYWELMQPLLLSHQLSNPKHTLHVHAIDWPDAELHAASSRFPNAKFAPCALPSEQGPLETLGPVPRSAEILKLKVQLLKQHYEETSDSVIWVDADTLLLKPIEPLLQRIESGGDFAVTYRKNKRDHAKFAVAVLCFTRTPAATKLLSAYAEGTETSTGLTKKSSTDGAAWFHDQLALWKAYKTQRYFGLGIRRPHGPKLVALRSDEHSIDGDIDSIFVSRREGVLDTDAMLAAISKTSHDNTAQ